MDQSTARSATTASTSGRGRSNENANGSPSCAHLPGGEVDEHRFVAGAEQHVGPDALAQGRRLRQQRLPPCLQAAHEVRRRCRPGGLRPFEPRSPVRGVALEVLALGAEDALDVRLREGMGDRDPSRVMSNVVCRDGQLGGVPAGAAQALDEHGLVREDRQFVTVDHVEPEELAVEEARRSRRGHHHAASMAST